MWEEIYNIVMFDGMESVHTHNLTSDITDINPVVIGDISNIT